MREKTKSEAKKVTCPTCKGNGLDKEHSWPDGSFASCETCEGYGEIERGSRVEFVTLPDDVREALTAAVYSHELSAILNCIAQAVRQSAEDNGYVEDMPIIEDDSRIVFHAAAYVSN